MKGCLKAALAILFFPITLLVALFKIK